MPSSKSKSAEVAGRNLAQGAKPLGARAAKRATKSTQTAESERLVRQPGQAPESYAASAWGTATDFEVTVPSGQKCLCRELTVERLIEMGLLQAINSLESIVANKVLPAAQGQRPPAEIDMSALVKDADKLMLVLDLVNAIVCEAVVAPRVHPVPEEGEERVAGLVYVDSIAMGDRFALFSEVTGNLEGLATFRQ
jgi:hypothetical protein